MLSPHSITFRAAELHRRRCVRKLNLIRGQQVSEFLIYRLAESLLIEYGGEIEEGKTIYIV